MKAVSKNGTGVKRFVIFSWREEINFTLMLMYRSSIMESRRNGAGTYIKSFSPDQSKSVAQHLRFFDF